MFSWMPTEAAALLVALFFAARNILVRSSQEHTTPLVSTFIITLVTGAFLLPFTLYEWSGSLINWTGIFWFFLGGVTAPGLALLLYFVSIQRIGVARSSPIASIQPLISLFIAVAFLGERPSIPVYIGSFLVVGGVVVLTPISLNSLVIIYHLSKTGDEYDPLAVTRWLDNRHCGLNNSFGCIPNIQTRESVETQATRDTLSFNRRIVSRCWLLLPHVCSRSRDGGAGCTAFKLLSCNDRNLDGNFFPKH